MKLVVNKSTGKVTITPPIAYLAYDQDLFVRVCFEQTDSYNISTTNLTGLRSKSFKLATIGSTPFSPRQVALTLKQFYHSDPVFVKEFSAIPTSFTLNKEFELVSPSGEFRPDRPITGTRNAYEYLRDFGLRVSVSLMNDAFKAVILDNETETGTTFSLLGEISWVTANPHYPHLGDRTIITRSDTFMVPFTTKPLEASLTGGQAPS